MCCWSGVDPGSFEGGSNQDAHTYSSYARLNYSYETEQKPKRNRVLLQLKISGYQNLTLCLNFMFHKSQI